MILFYMKIDSKKKLAAQTETENVIFWCLIGFELKQKIKRVTISGGDN